MGSLWRDEDGGRAWSLKLKHCPAVQSRGQLAQEAPRGLVDRCRAQGWDMPWKGWEVAAQMDGPGATGMERGIPQSFTPEPRPQGKQTGKSSSPLTLGFPGTLAGASKEEREHPGHLRGGQKDGGAEPTPGEVRGDRWWSTGFSSRCLRAHVHTHTPHTSANSHPLSFLYSAHIPCLRARANSCDKCGRHGAGSQAPAQPLSTPPAWSRHHHS